MAVREDLALLQQTMPVGCEGLKGLEKFVRDGNSEMRKLLYDECDVMLECRYCRNIFRSPINFVSHKRAFCRASHVAVAMANGSRWEDDGRTETATKKRVGQMSALTRRLESNLVPIGDTPEMMTLYTLPRIMKELPLTTFADGFQKVIGSLPGNLAQKEALPEDRVCVTMPQDNSSRYKEMSLRSRKAQNTDKPQHRDFTTAEVKVIENFAKNEVRCADFVSLQCDHPSCAHVRPFHTIQALAFHCSLRHTAAFTDSSGEERWPCLLCSRQMWSYEGVATHLKRVHALIKEEHLRKRAEEDKTASKGGRKGTHHATGRSRSMSVDLDAPKAADEEEEEDQEEQMIIDEEEEEEGRGRRRARGGGATTTRRPASLQLQQPQQLDRESRASDNSEEYGDPPVLHPADESEEEEDADEEDYEYRPSKGGKKKKSVTPDSEKKDEEDTKKNEEEEEEEDVKDSKWNTVEGCMESLLDAVCEAMGEEVTMKTSASDKKSRSTDRRSGSSSASKPKRGRPPKRSEVEDKNEAPKAGRPKKSEGGVEVKPKRQYIRKKDRESMERAQKEKEKEKERERETASSEHSQDSLQPSTSAAAEAARPSRQRKRPRWMLEGDDEIFEGDGAKKKEGDSAAVDESEEEDTPKEEIKKQKKTVGVTPMKKEKKESSQVGTMKSANSSQGQEIFLFTPRSGRYVRDKMLAAERDASSTTHKRKQNLLKLADDSEDIMIVSVNDPMNGPRKSDLSAVPVYLSEKQQSIFFAGLLQMKSPDGDANKDRYECMYCKTTLPNVRDGRRHMVAHLRVMRLRCGLCGAGSFFCIDMRNHLQMRGCPELAKAPKGMIRNGVPCMTKENADELTFVAHSGSPGRALFTSGKIVSIINNSPHFPDPVIEEKILGPTRVPPPHSSPRKQAHKLTLAATVLKEAEKGTVSLAAVHRSSTAPAASAPVLPIEDAGVHYYEDTTEEDAAAAAAEAEYQQRAAVASTSKSASMPPPDHKPYRIVGEPANARAVCLPPAVAVLEAASASTSANASQASARRTLNFSSDTPSTSTGITAAASSSFSSMETASTSRGLGAVTMNGHGSPFNPSSRMQPSVGARSSSDPYQSSNYSN